MFVCYLLNTSGGSYPLRVHSTGQIVGRTWNAYAYGGTLGMDLALLLYSIAYNFIERQTSFPNSVRWNARAIPLRMYSTGQMILQLR